MSAPQINCCRADNSGGYEEFRARTRVHRDGTGTILNGSRFNLMFSEDRLMGRYLLLWPLGVPLPILFLIWIIGGLH
jgi:hypothetical protein